MMLLLLSLPSWLQGAPLDLATSTSLAAVRHVLPLGHYRPVSRPRRHLPDSKQADRQTPSPEINSTSAEEEVAISASPPPFTVPEGFDKNGSAEYYRNLIYEQYSDGFVNKLPAQLPPLRVVNHRIPIKVDKPWMAPLYRLPEHHKKAPSKRYRAEVAISGIMVPTTELPLATSYMVPKKDPGELRLVQDLRRHKQRNGDTSLAFAC
jgi:hypothetical protein